MTYKLLEIRDRDTFIPALAILVSEADGYLAKRAGFGSDPCIFLVTLATEHCSYDPYHWSNRTMTTAHEYIRTNWDAVINEDVIDVEYIRGESPTKKVSERATYFTDFLDRYLTNPTVSFDAETPQP